MHKTITLKITMPAITRSQTNNKDVQPKEAPLLDEYLKIASLSAESPWEEKQSCWIAYYDLILSPKSQCEHFDCFNEGTRKWSIPATRRSQRLINRIK